MRSFVLLFIILLALPASGQVLNIYVWPQGNDTGAGSRDKPLQSLQKALLRSRAHAGAKVSIQLLEGTYYLDETVRINAQDSCPRELEIRGYQNHHVIISAGRRLKPEWHYFREGIYRAPVDAGVSFERLYVNGVLQTMARYPDADSSAKPFYGTAEDATYYMRVLSWGNPYGGYVHGLDEDKKGSLHYRITGVDDTDNVELEGGWQHRWPLHMHHTYRFVENVFGELDTPGEWYLDQSVNMLYYYPAPGTNLSTALIEVSNLKNSMELKGTVQKPLQNVKLRNLHFRHNERTFMDSRDSLPGSDPAVYRGGAVLLENTGNCTIEDCSFVGLGGNALMFNGQNQRDTVVGCLISHVGATGVSFLGAPGATRMPDKGDPGNCLVRDNLLQYVGEIEKQGSGIHLSNVSAIVVENNTIKNSPGEAIKIEHCPTGAVRLVLNEVLDEFRELDRGILSSKEKPLESNDPGPDTGVRKAALRKLLLK